MKGASLKYLTHEGFRNIWVNRLMSLASVTVLLACLVIIGVGAMAYFNINALLDKVEAQNVVMVYVTKGSDDLTTSTVGLELQKLSNIETCEFIPKEDALKEQIEELGGDNAIFEGLTENPLPDAYRVTLKDLSQFSQTVSQIKGIANVDSVRENSDLASKLMSVRHAVTIVSVGLVVMLFLVALFIIANTIRVTMYSRRMEISIMKSVGATNWFVRWPFVVEGIVIGLVAGILASVLLLLLYNSVMQVITGIAAFFVPIPVTDLILPYTLVFVIAGAAFGAVGGAISIGKYLRKGGSELVGL